VQRAAEKIVGILEREGVPYAVIGALALNEHGHRRVTVDVDLVMREEDLQAFKHRWLGQGYAERVPGTGKLIDTELGVHIDVLSPGRFPGDDKPKPIMFPDPAVTAIRGKPFALLPIERWIELKLASGMVAPHRLKRSRRRTGAHSCRRATACHLRVARSVGSRPISGAVGRGCRR